MATEVAAILHGKTSVVFVRNAPPTEKVRVVGAAKMRIDEKKARTKKYVRYSGYPGGLKSRSLRELVIRKGYAEVLRKAVLGMLPRNKMRSKMMLNLKIEE